MPESPPGNYTIITVGGSSDNYYFTYFDGTLIINPRLSLTVKIFIEGFYKGNGLMDNNGTGGYLFLTGGSPNPSDVDSVTIQLMDPVTKLEVDSQTGILQTNGDLVVTFGSAITVGNSYYIVVRHRQSIETWSALPVVINNATTFDFIHY